MANVDQIVAEAGFSGDVDLLSIDVDGNDYWVLSALESVSPRAIVLEYQTAWGPDRRVTQRYREDFHISQVPAKGTLPRCGASLAAFRDLLATRGYRLVGKERSCFNAFFLRNDVGLDHFPEVATSACFDHPTAQYRMKDLEDHPDDLLDMWQEV